MQQSELLAFPEGWQQKVVIRQRCQNAVNPIQDFFFSFDDVDETGTFALTLTLNITNYGDGYSSPAGTRLIRWNDKGWGKHWETG